MHTYAKINLLNKFMDTWHMGKENCLQQVVLEKLDILMPKKKEIDNLSYTIYQKISAQCIDDLSTRHETTLKKIEGNTS